MSGPGLRELVDPAHPLVQEAFRPSTRAEGARAVLARALEDARAHFAYRAVRGRLGFARLRELRAANGSAPVDINCIELSALLASQLRRAGLSADEVFVALCDERWLQGRVRNDYHACVLVMAGGELQWIAPETLEPVSLRPGALLERYKLHVLFNDHHLYFTEAEKNRLLRRDMANDGIKCFLYGRSDPATQGVLDDPGLWPLLKGCFRDGRTGEVEPALAQRATACGMLAPAADGSGTWSPGPRLVLVPAAAEREFHAAVEPWLDPYLGIVAESVPALERAYAACSAAARFPWPAVCHAMVAGMLVDLAVGAQLHLAEDVRRTHGSGVVWAFERVPAHNGFGIHWISPPSHHCGIARLWHVRVKRPPLRLEPRMVEMLAGHACGERVASGPDALYLRFVKLLRGADITIPTFLPADTERLLGPLMDGAARIVQQAILPALQKASAQEIWRRLGQQEEHRHAGVRLLLEYAIDRVVGDGLLQAFPEGEAIDPAWGAWLWIESKQHPARLVPANFLGET